MAKPRLRGGMMRAALLLSAAVLALTGCGRDDPNRLPFDGVIFKTKTKKAGDELALFNAAVSPVSASLEGARAAAEYEGVKYCIANFGSSDIDWIVGPETDVTRLIVEDDTLVYQGRCDS